MGSYSPEIRALQHVQLGPFCWSSFSCAAALRCYLFENFSLSRSTIARLCRMLSVHFIITFPPGSPVLCKIRNPVDLFSFQFLGYVFLIFIAARFKRRIIIKSVQILMFPTSSSLVEINPDFWELCYETKGVGKSEFKLFLAQGEVRICFSPVCGHVSTSDHT